jgi:hypothetical protein
MKEKEETQKKLERTHEKYTNWLEVDVNGEMVVSIWEMKNDEEKIGK